jgi:Berberine and berberine like
MTTTTNATSARGAYVNFLTNEGQDRVKASYRGNYDRLAQVKRRYDPDNTFHLNQNIQPASQPASPAPSAARQPGARMPRHHLGGTDAEGR